MNKTKISRIKRQIKDAKESLILEKQEIGWYDDSNGERYWIAEQYHTIGDYKGLLDYYDWFYKEFDDDIGTPEMLVVWIDTFYREQLMDVFSKRFVELEDMNTHLIPLLADIYTEEKAKWEWSNYAMLEYAKFTCGKFKNKVSSDLLEFIRQLYKDNRYRDYKEALIDYYVSLENLRPGVERTHTLKKIKEHLFKMEQYIIEYDLE